VVLPLAFDIRAERAGSPSILRIYSGQTLPGQLDAYVEEAMKATRADAAAPVGPIAVCMGIDRADRFVTASVWSDWSSIEASTGGDIERPLLSRNQARLAAGGPTHFEIIADR
jgi:hypothetical protein